MWILCSKEIFPFPCSFILGVIAPLDLEKFSCFLTGPPFRLFQYLYWPLSVGEVWLHVNVFMGYLLLWIAYVLPQLRDVEHVVDIG